MGSPLMQLPRWIWIRLAQQHAPAVALGLMLVTTSASAWADPLSNDQLAQSLFDRGRQLMDQQRFSEACPILAESQRLDPAGGTLLNLAMCHEGGGQLATAYTEYNEALSWEDRIRGAKERLVALATAVPRLTVRVSPAATLPGLIIELDGTALPASAWGQPVMVNAGEHRLRASAANRTPWYSVVIVQRGDLRAIDIPMLGAPASAQPPTLLGDRASAEPIRSSAVPEPRQRRSAGFYIMTTLGAAAATAGLYCLLFSSIQSSSDSTDSVDSLRTAMWVSFGVSVASFGVAFALPTVAVMPPTAPTTVRIPAVVTIAGRF